MNSVRAWQGVVAGSSPSKAEERECFDIAAALIADLSTVSVVGYALAGGAGTAILAMVAPILMYAYTDAAAAAQVSIAVQFATLLQMVWRAIWQFLDAILLAAWWLGIGWLLRPDHLRLSRLSLALAAAATAAAANITGLNLVRDVLLGVLFTLWIAWWISLLVVLARQAQTGSTIAPSGQIDKGRLV